MVLSKGPSYCQDSDLNRLSLSDPVGMVRTERVGGMEEDVVCVEDFLSVFEGRLGF